MTQTEVREQHIVSAAVDAETRERLQRMAREDDRSLSSVVRAALRRYLGDNDEGGETHE